MVGIVILNYCNSGYTVACVESILQFSSTAPRIVVVDNASPDDSMQSLGAYLQEHPGVFTLVRAERNGGYAQGNNVGLEVLEGDPEVSQVMILNNDVLFTSDIIPTLSEFLQAHPEAGIVSPLLRCRDGVSVDNTCARRDCSIREIVWTYLLYFTNICGILSRFADRRKILPGHPELLERPCVPIELPSGSCMLIDKALFRKIGWFDPGTFLYYEENILYRKLLSEGKISYMLPSVDCIHLGGVTTNKVPHSASYMKSSKSSGYYYATHYRRMSPLQRLVLRLAYAWYNTLVDIVKGIKSIKGLIS